MRILLLADINSVHTKKWIAELSRMGLHIGIFSLTKEKKQWTKNYENVKIFNPLNLNKNIFQASLINKLLYLKAVPYLRRDISEFKPDIVHSHYASSYGLLGSLAKFHPYVISVWGSDIYDFPNKNILNKFLINYNLKKADKILSTSHTLAKEIKRYTNKEVEVIPFGVDLEKFKPLPKHSTFNIQHSTFNQDDIVIGTIKSLEKNYGIEYLMKAFKLLTDRNPDLPLKLLIVGGGSLEFSLKELAKKLKINNKVTFTGFIDSENIPAYHNMLSVFVAVSLSESFGVSVIEASACEKPVVVSNIGGLPEVVEDGVTGLIVEARNTGKTADAIEKLIKNKVLATQLGKNGRQRVKLLYDINKNTLSMIQQYENLLNT